MSWPPPSILLFLSPLPNLPSIFSFRHFLPSISSASQLTISARHSLPHRAPMIQSLSHARCTASETLPTSLLFNCPRLLSVCPPPLPPSPSTWLPLRRPASARPSLAKAHGPPSTSSSYPCLIANSSGSNCKSSVSRCLYVPLLWCPLFQTG